MARHSTPRSTSLLVEVLILSVLLFVGPEALDAAGKQQFKASHAPRQPKTGEVVTVTVKAPSSVQAGELMLQYQIVEPGNYIALADTRYPKGWEEIPLKKAPEASEDKAPRFTADLPADLQKNRRLIRYRVSSLKEKNIVAPAKDDTQSNYAYFVYDGVPEWRAAIRPGAPGKDGELRTFPAEAMRSVQAYHLISNRRALENVTWREPTGLGSQNRHDYKYTATLVADGEVYDHVGFRARGGGWRHAMGKNMWKIDFNKGHHLEARDNYLQKYKAKWAKLNLGACIQQGDYGMRGEHGLLEAVSYRLFNLVGVETSHTHWIQLRIVDGPDENPDDQYRGDFWGLYLATEEVDDEFLEEHQLPDGNIYKIDFGDPKPEHIARDGPTDRSDVIQFMTAMRRAPDARWWQANVDLPRYYGYRSIVECIHHYDIGGGKNYFFYHNPQSKRWHVIPWDVDLTWANHMYGNGAEPFYVAGVLRADSLKGDYINRLTEIRDLLFNPEQAGALIDEYAAMISNPNGGLSMTDADRAKWDYHPIMSSQWSVRGKADPGLFYRQSPTRDFRGMVQLMKNYVKERGEWVDQTLLAGASSPVAPKIAPTGKLDPSASTLKLAMTTATPPTLTKWRLAEITQASGSDSKPVQPGRYEINSLWEASGGTTVEIPTKTLVGGHTYRIRARVQDASGRWSHWSPPLQFTKDR